MFLNKLDSTLFKTLWALLDVGLASFIALAFRPKGATAGKWWREEGYAIWLIAAGIIAMLLIVVQGLLDE